MEKNYKLAHKAYCNCFDRARVEEKSEVVSHIFINMAAAGTVQHLVDKLLHFMISFPGFY